MIKEIENKIGQLQYEISCLGLDKEDLTAVTIRMEELKELVKKLTIPVVVSSAVSKDYTKLYDKVNKGETVPCFVDYKSFNLKKVYRDIASIRKRPDNSIDIGVRGISYGGVSEWHLKDITEFEAFIYECKRLNLEYYT